MRYFSNCNLWSSSPPSPQNKPKVTIRTCLTQTGAKVFINWRRAIFYASRITWRGGIPGGGPGPAPWTATHGTGRQRHRGYRPQRKFANTHVAFTCQCPPPLPVLNVGGGSDELHFDCSLPRACQHRAMEGTWAGKNIRPPTSPPTWSTLIWGRGGDQHSTPICKGSNICPCTVPGSGLSRSRLGNQGGSCGGPRGHVAPRVSSVAWRCATKSDGASDAMKDEKHAGKKFV